MAQMIVTLPNGDQVAIRTAAEINDENTSVMLRKGPADCWTAPLSVARPHSETGVHFGEW